MGGFFLLIEIVLDEGIDNRVNEVGDHGHHEVLPDHCDKGAGFVGHLLSEQCLFLLVNGTLENLLNLGGDTFEHCQNDVDLVLTEAEYHEEGLQIDFDDGFTNESCSEKHTEGDQEVTTQETSQVKEWVRNL